MWLKKLQKKQVKMFGLPFFPSRMEGHGCPCPPSSACPAGTDGSSAGTELPANTLSPAAAGPQHVTIRNSKKHLAFLHLTFSGLKVWRHRATTSTGLLSLPPSCLPSWLSAILSASPVALGWRGRVAILLRFGPHITLQGSSRLHWGPQVCGQPVFEVG